MIKTPVTACPECGYKINAATDAFGHFHIPRPDDISVCLKCAALLIFNNDLTVRKAELSDMVKWTTEEHADAERAVQVVKRKRK